MKIVLPDIATQQMMVFRSATADAISRLEENLKAPHLPAQTEVDENLYPRTHLLREKEGYETPHKDIVRAYFNHFKEHFPAYASDQKLAELLGISGDRHIRRFKEGTRVPFGIWRRFLVITGRAPQEIIPVMAFMG